MTLKTRTIPSCRHDRATLTIDLKTDKELDGGKMRVVFRSGKDFQMVVGKQDFQQIMTGAWRGSTQRGLIEPLE